MKILISALVLTVAFAGSGQGASAASNGPETKTAPRHAAASDAQIERNIRARLARSKISQTNHFTVTVKDGVATLEGKTNVIQHKGVATRLAKAGGAIAVENHIQISEEARARAAARLAAGRKSKAPPPRATVIPAQ